MKYQKPQIVFHGKDLKLIQAGVKNWVLLLDFVLVASTTAYEADE